MIQVIHWRINMPSGAATRCYVPFEGLPNEELTAGLGRAPIAAAGTLRNLRVWTSAAPGANIVATLFVNGVASALQVTLNTGTASATDTDSVAVAVDDLIEFRLQNSTGSGSRILKCSVDFEATDANASIYGFGDAAANIGAAGAREAILCGGEWAADTDTYSLVGTDGTVTRWTIRLSTAPGAGTNRLFRIYKNGTAQDGTGGTPDTTITIADAAQAGSASFSLSVVAGDTVHARLVSNSGAPAATRVTGTCKFVSTTPGRWNGGLFSFAGPSTSDTPPAYHFPLGHAGTSAWSSTTESDREFRNGPTACWLSQMRAVSLNSPGSGGDAWVFKLRKNSADGNQSVTIADAAVLAGPSSARDQLADGDSFAVRWEELVTPGSSTGMHLAWQFSETDPIGALEVDKAETLTITEDVARELTGHRSAAETLTITEALEFDYSEEAKRQASDNLVITEHTRLVFGVQKAVDDALTITEFVAAELVLVQPGSASDNLTITEFVKAVLSPLVVQVYETLAIQERAVSDPAGLLAVERLRITDHVVVGVNALAVLVFETLTISEGALNHTSGGSSGGVSPGQPPVTAPPGGLQDYWIVGI